MENSSNVTHVEAAAVPQGKTAINLKRHRHFSRRALLVFHALKRNYSFDYEAVFFLIILRAVAVAGNATYSASSLEILVGIQFR